MIIRKGVIIMDGCDLREHYPEYASLIGEGESCSTEALNIGKRIHDVRKGKELTLKQLADLVGVTSAFVNNVEQGFIPLSREFLCKLASVLECGVSFLSCGTVEELSSFSVKEEVQKEEDFVPWVSVANSKDSVLFFEPCSKEDAIRTRDDVKRFNDFLLKKGKRDTEPCLFGVASKESGSLRILRDETIK